tara:strand:- start:2391 stop:2939 length:549 start_codon:yes stop_codon:yes gene_type:complete
MNFNELWSEYLKEEKAKPKKKTAREKKCPGVKGSEFHSKTGEFSSKEDAASNSLWFSCPALGRTRKGKKSISDPPDSGRGRFKTRGKGKYRIKDNKPLWEESEDGMMRINKQALELMVREAFAEVLDRWEELKEPEVQSIQDDNKKQKLVKVCKKLGLDSFANHLKRMNLIKKAEDGDLFEK